MRRRSTKPSTKSAPPRLKAGKIPGIYCRDAARALAMAKRGFRFLTIGSDFGAVRDRHRREHEDIGGHARNTKDPF